MAYIRHLETLVPATRYSQEEICEVLVGRAQSERSRRYIKKALGESGIVNRHSVITDFKNGEERLFTHADGSFREPSTGERNAVYVGEVRSLVPEIARRALANCPGISANEITHVVTVSCTGFFNPGPDLLVIEALNLSPTVQRYHLGFMGCYAAFPALRMAAQFCEADPLAVVLVVCVELCTIHMQTKEDLDSIVANSVFADGAAAAIVSAKAPGKGERCFGISRFASSLVREGANDMAWDIGDQGFNIVLSKYVSRIIGAGIRSIIDGVFAGSGMSPNEMLKWAIHPGGRAILDKVEGSLGLLPEQVGDSRATLAEFGNMSSATILFVLKRIIRDLETKDGDPICAMAFGPGLTIETSILHAVVS
ncbi:type III polyketide synthase [Haloferula sp.]|uniref:type III polyketide synthase n=1 Tax=Haloferula sp. TaxID=2497595 RepID=UPI003C723958